MISRISIVLTLVVGAIDFGTTYSGWAFSLKTDYERDPTVASVKHWHAGSGTLATIKTPTCLLVKPDGKTFDSFGYDAENKYRDLVDGNLHNDYYFFSRFKMALYKQLGQKIDRNMTLQEEMGKQLLALDVFAMSIKYLMDDMIEVVEKRLLGIIYAKDIHWVLTVPAIWSDAAKQFMRESATRAGILTEKLVIALEPEAASLYCRHLPLDATADSDDVSISKLSIGTKYMVVDAGGGTIDITVHQVHESNTLREVRSASGGNWGGTMVDKAFEEFLVSIVGKGLFEEFKHVEKEDYLYMMREFESKKREATTNAEGRIVIHFPASLKELYEEKYQKEIREAFADSIYVNELELKRDKLKLSKLVFDKLFEESIQKAIGHIKRLMNEENMEDVNIFLMVGGYSESLILQKAVKEAFPTTNVVIPLGCETAVLRGALIYGHNPISVCERILRYTYGTNMYVPFVAGKHPENKYIITDTGNKCSDVFAKYVKVDQVMKIGVTQVKKRFFTTYKRQKCMGFRFYASLQKDPKYVDDKGCFLVGKMNLSIEGPNEKPGRAVNTVMSFGGTEIIVEAEDEKTGNKIVCSIDFLG